MYISTPPSPEDENLLPRQGSNPGLAEPEADMLPSQPARRANIRTLIVAIYQYFYSPSHCEIVGHEMADTLAKKGTLIPPYRSEVPYAQLASIIYHKLWKTHRDLLVSKISNHQWKGQIQALPY